MSFFLFPANLLLDTMMKGKSRCLEILPPPSWDLLSIAVLLPTNLLLQLDNSAKDNKNESMMAFFSLLTHHSVFNEIQVGFLLIGHAHEDIDTYFSHLSKTSKTRNIFGLAHLMKSFMKSQEMSFMLEFI